MHGARGGTPERRLVCRADHKQPNVLQERIEKLGLQSTKGQCRVLIINHLMLIKSGKG